MVDLCLATLLIDEGPVSRNANGHGLLNDWLLSAFRCTQFSLFISRRLGMLVSPPTRTYACEALKGHGISGSILRAGVQSHTWLL
jgi:hypothetical protein